MAPTSTDTLGYWGQPTSTIDWCEYNYEVRYEHLFAETVLF